MKRWLRFTAAVLAAAFLFALTGCGSSTNSASFTWFVDSIPANLDPQVASGASDVIACENLYGTLVRKDPDGELVPGLCEEWTVSPDGLTYTFTLKDGLTYAAAKGAATEYDITAEDFVFAFRRIFRADTASPYAVEFSAIQNSAAVLAGLADESSLGVSANGALSLVFRLSERDDNFLAKLAMPGAAPCDETFFESTRGTYGLTAKTTLASGSFYLRRQRQMCIRDRWKARWSAVCVWCRTPAAAAKAQPSLLLTTNALPRWMRAARPPAYRP